MCQPSTAAPAQRTQGTNTRQTLAAFANTLPPAAAALLKDRRVNGYPLRLNGTGNTAIRQVIIEAITGKRVSKTAASVSGMMKAIIGVAPELPGSCQAVRQAWLRVWILRYN